MGPPIHLTVADASRPSWRGGQDVYPSTPKLPDGRYIVVLLCGTLFKLLCGTQLSWHFCVWFFSC